MTTRAGNEVYDGPHDLPAATPVFPLPGALLLPRRVLPLNIFEPRYLAMVEAAIQGDRLIGMIQPKVDVDKPLTPMRPPLEKIGCLGRITQWGETGDGRLTIGLTGVARFRVVEELSTTTPWRVCQIDATPFPQDFEAGFGEAEVDRGAVLATLEAWLAKHAPQIDRASFEEAGNEALVDGLAMMSPCGPREKQALLEAANPAIRAELLIAITERALGEGGVGRGPLQ
ncbi:MAG: LON peptidase substrate-binding domain-containing protein [Hyphomicrobiales bacterium]|nr:LON peptidase substrate-binding domain-containing protein [Hyphomicrobiales bacterium]